MADPSQPKQSLYESLAEQLPQSVPFTFHHYSTPPTKSPSLFSAPPHAKPERTFCESHFLAASITPQGSSDELLILAIEVLVYTTKSLTTIFVSKADSTGYISLLKLPRSQAGSPLKIICGTFVSWLAKERQRYGKKVVVSLFARAQNQYLFPASIDNKDKHVLDDRGLVKWWCKVLDPIMQEYGVARDQKTLKERLTSAPTDSIRDSPTAGSTAKGYLVIPGFEHYDTLRYVPPPPSTSEPRRWATTHPLLDIAPYPNAPPRCLVPHFPDDPKARFLDELDDELPDRGNDSSNPDAATPSRSNGQWKSVKTLDQFWEFMAYRQECSSGRIVGFIWIVITPPQPSIPEEDETEDSSQALSSLSQTDTLATDNNSPASTPERKKKKRSRRRKVNLEYGPIPLILPRIKSSSSNLSSMIDGSRAGSVKTLPENTPYYKWPADSRGTVVLSAKDYDRAHEILIQQNFATRSAAVRSTRRWKEEVAVLAGVNSWSNAVIGKKEAKDLLITAAVQVTPVTVMGVRKKRKPNEPAQPEVGPSSSAENPTMLGEGLVRKKVKTEAGADGGASAANGVNTLGAGLVRRKPKS
ncbi:unnamed protein product [Periconia digitata]|uniref:histone acetyltransferase n=1 Tax=Periconia digitata TaxID=1303443 RepID=A0A9W4U650_9PLEO|nr:unnamed protein product [Periconia digitata]